MNLEGYVPVNDRLTEALKRWPDLRVQESAFDIMRIDDQTFLVCEVTVWRTADDPKPSIATAAEPFPGKTPYTRGSERMVGFTSALGRALGYMGIGIDKAMASSNEIEARVEPRDTRSYNTPLAASEAQKRMLRALGYTGPDPTSKQEASKIIDALKERKKDLGEDEF